LSVSLLEQSLADSIFPQDKFCNPVRQYDYKKISICLLFMQNMLVIDPGALRLRGSGFVGMRRQFCRILGR
jgi:hypothetical protein